MSAALRFSLLSLCCVLLVSCASPPSRWQRSRELDVRDVSTILDSSRVGLLRDERPEEMAAIPVRRRLRPCCAFGSGLRVRIGRVAVPGIAIGNIRSPEAIGRHTYDAGRGRADTVIGSESNGLVYTCRGGFIDIAHVRDYADWTLYLASEFGRRLETGGTIDLPGSEGGRRRFHLSPIDPELVSVVGRRNLSAAMAVWAGFQLSIWHEIATWYGWASFDLFSERASAFSPEDLYSNLLGAKIAGAIVSERSDLSENLFNEAVDSWLGQSLEFLQAVPAEMGEEAMARVDGIWWDSSARLPDANLVLRRSLEVGNRIRPFLVEDADPGGERGAALDRACSGERGHHVLRNPSRIPGFDFDSLVRFEIELDSVLAERLDGGDSPGRVDQREFPAILESIRRGIHDEFGPQGDSPGPTVAQDLDLGV